MDGFVLYMSFFLAVMLITLFYYLKNKKKFNKEDKDSNRLLEKDDLLYFEGSEGTMTLEEAEKGMTFVDDPQSFGETNTVYVDETKYSEVLKDRYRELPPVLQEKLTVEFICFLEAMIDEVTYNPKGADHELTDEIIEEVQKLISVSEINLTIDEIKTIWLKYLN